MVASAPGPAMNGNASGNTEMSSRFMASSRSGMVDLVPEVRANTISSEIKNSRVPPAMRNELNEIPMMERNRAPPNANSTQIASAMAAALPAIFLLNWSLAPRVKPANNGTNEIGSTTTKNTTKNFMSCSTMSCCCAQNLHIARNAHWELNGVEHSRRRLR